MPTLVCRLNPRNWLLQVLSQLRWSCRACSKQGPGWSNWKRFCTIQHIAGTSRVRLPTFRFRCRLRRLFNTARGRWLPGHISLRFWLLWDTTQELILSPWVRYRRDHIGCSPAAIWGPCFIVFCRLKWLLSSVFRCTKSALGAGSIKTFLDCLRIANSYQQMWSNFIPITAL